MAVSGYQLAVALFGEHAPYCVEFGIVAHRCLADWIRDDRVVRPTEPARAITVRQIARSLNASPETVRRHVKVLVGRGALTVSASGVSLAVTDANEPFVARYLYGVHDLMVRLFAEVAATTDLRLPLGQPATVGLGDIVTRAIEVLLLPIDTYPLSGNQLDFLMWAALTAVAVRSVTYDPVLARTYAIDIPPDELRVGISLRRVAEVLSIPYASAWRQMRMLHDRGLVTRLGKDQWTVLTANLLVDSAVAVGAPPSAYTLRKLRELTLLGFDPAQAEGRYRLGRPAVTDYGI